MGIFRAAYLFTMSVGNPCRYMESIGSVMPGVGSRYAMVPSVFSPVIGLMVVPGGSMGVI